MELKQLQHEIFEAERLIERNKIILQMHVKLEEMAKEIALLRENKTEGPNGN
jgi:hypothetical protein